MHARHRRPGGLWDWHWDRRCKLPRSSRCSSHSTQSRCSSAGLPRQCQRSRSTWNSRLHWGVHMGCGEEYVGRSGAMLNCFAMLRFALGGGHVVTRGRGWNTDREEGAGNMVRCHRFASLLRDDGPAVSRLRSKQHSCGLGEVGSSFPPLQQRGQLLSKVYQKENRPTTTALAAHAAPPAPKPLLLAACAALQQARAMSRTGRGAPPWACLGLHGTPITAAVERCLNSWAEASAVF